MGDRQSEFLGTPLSWILSEDVEENSKFILRSSRSNRGQIVKDDEGRRRFHGAFTGGYSSGYHGTVDTIGGFQPKSFITNRAGPSRDKDTNATAHQLCPEDYMDEEDFGEFGIAPKKIRLNDSYMLDRPFERNRTKPFDYLRPANCSIGEKILNQLSGGRFLTNPRTEHQGNNLFKRKNDYQGLGYFGLMRASELSCAKPSNPLVAILEKGKRLEISGEAFGEGVLADDDDQAIMVQEYGVHHLDDYDFYSRQSKGRSNINQRNLDEEDKAVDDASDLWIPGFKLARCSDTQQVCDYVRRTLYILPNIPDDWSPPKREVTSRDSLVTADEINSEFIKLQKLVRESGNFSDRFVSSNSDKILKFGGATHFSGLLTYTDLKAQECNVERKDQEKSNEEIDQNPLVERHVLDWHPCSLLCKHFNVPNPYPGSEYSGVRSQDFLEAKTSDSNPNMSDTTVLAPIEFRKSIFNTNFDDVVTTEEEEEDLPQLLTLEETVLSDANKVKPEVAIYPKRPVPHDSDEDSDVLVCDALKPQPELIVLSSSSTSPDVSESKNTLELHGEDEDTYGPPLPPSHRTLKIANRHSSGTSCSQSLSRSKKKHTKHKKRH